MDQKNQPGESQDQPHDAGANAFAKQGPLNTYGVEASDLPDGGRGSTDTDFGKEAARLLPEQHGGEVGGQSGLRAMPNAVKADARGNRGKN